MRLCLRTADWRSLTRRLKCSSFFCREPPWNLPEGFAVPFEFQTTSRDLLKELSLYSLLVYYTDQETSLFCFGSFLLEELPAPGGTVRAVSSWYLRLQCALADRHDAYPPPARPGPVERRGKTKKETINAKSKRKGWEKIDQTWESGLRKMRESQPWAWPAGPIIRA